MKRIFLRMSALATVVALGLIAIAQAQRGVDQPTVADPSPTPASTSLTVTEDPSTPTGSNPLRSPAVSDDAPAASPAPADYPHSRRRPESATPTPATSLTDLPPNDRSYPPPSAPPAEPAAPPSDPFSFMARDRNPGADARPPAGFAAEAPQQLTDVSSLPEAPERPFPGREPPSSYSTRPTASSGYGDRVNPGGAAPDTFSRVEPLPETVVDSAPRTLPAQQFAADGYSTMPASSQPARDTRPGAMSSLASLPPAEGTGRPGDKELEGPQTPQLTIEKTAPEEIRIGRPATFTVMIRNTGQATAADVEIHDRIPRGTKLQETKPPASRGPQGELIWQLGAVEPNADVSVEMVLIPVEEGEIGSVATVHFNAAASARTIVTKPQLVLTTTLPDKVHIGGDVPISITVTNPGTGIATGVLLEERIPDGLEHPAGTELEYEVGDLAPNESRQLDLVLKAVEPGVTANLLTARDDADLVVEDRKELEVVAPQLAVMIEGPKRRYLGRQATYTCRVKNPGTAPARQVELVAELPSGFTFVSANNNGSFDAAASSVRWNLEELPVGEVAPVELVAMPAEAGEQMIRFSTSDESGLSAQTEQPVLVEGIAAIFFEVVDVEDPIEVGEQTTYEVRVVNQGSKAATNVQLATHMPREMQFVSAEGPVRHAAEPGRVLFEPLPRLAPKADTTYRIHVKGVQPGDLRLRVELSTNEISRPVNKEESTRVYSDE